jgi:hypothetical protein
VATAQVLTKGDGLGGIRRLRVECTDAAHAWHTVASAAGTWDIRATVRTVSWTVPNTARYTASCRSVIASKTRWVASASRSVVLG